METKQVIVLRKDLKMRKGKMVAQGAHASLKVILDMMNKATTFEHICDPKHKQDTWTLCLSHQYPLHHWITGQFKKICVSVNSEEELISIYNQAKEAKLPCVLIEDNGLTEFNGVKTKTCVAIGPALEEDINNITKELKLL